MRGGKGIILSHDQSTTSPFRKVSTGTWADRKVMNLSRMEPSGQAMFVMLLIGPQTTSMPGVQPVGRLAFSEMLEWEPEAFDKAFQEVFEQGLAKADWKARFVFVPKAIQHNLPQSPNVVKSWASTWARVPDCDLKREAWKTIFQALTALGKSFADAFKTACPLDFYDDSEVDEKPSAKASGKPSEKATDNQKQEKEQKQKQKQEQKSFGSNIDPDGATDSDGSEPAAAPVAPPKNRRGSCLAEDWRLPKGWGDWALENRPDLTDADVRHQAACFADYWHGKAGPDAHKADWEATWRNWIRRADGPPAPKGGPSHPLGRTSPSPHSHQPKEPRDVVTSI